MNKVNKESPNLINKYHEWLLEKFPSCFIEGKLDFEKLKQLLSEISDDRDEKFTFSWAGRSNSIKNIQLPSHGTLIPSKNESINFDDTENIFIEGENLEVLKLLQKTYYGKIKMIYTDPPYNTGNDFLYKDDFKQNIESYLKQTGQVQEGIKLTTNPDTSGRFHSDWISFMYPRLFLAKELLRDDGIIFVSIDDNEIQHLKLIMNEIFGEENFIALITWRQLHTVKNSAKHFSKSTEYVLVYAKNLTNISKIRQPAEKGDNYPHDDNDGKGKYKLDPLSARNKNIEYEFYFAKWKIKWKAPLGSYPRYSEKTLRSMYENNEIAFKEGWKDPRAKRYLANVQEGIPPSTFWDGTEVGFSSTGTGDLAELLSRDAFLSPKPVGLIKRCMEISLNQEKSIVLDFFVGSGTTAQAALELNKNPEYNINFICVQIPEKIPGETKVYSTISEIAKDRIRKAIEKFKSESNQTKLINTKQDLGFKVFKLAKSNYKIWEEVGDKEKFQEQSKLFENPLIENYKIIDVIYEIIVKEGYSLNSKIEKFQTKPNQIYKITDDEFFFYVTLDPKLDFESLKKLNLNKNIMFICLDSSIDDTQKTNLKLQCKLKTI